MWNIRNWEVEVNEFKKDSWRSVRKGETLGRDLELRCDGRAHSQFRFIYLSWLTL